MYFENLVVVRLIIHEIHRRLDDKRPVPPKYGTQLVILDDEALEYFRGRVVTVMGNQSQSMEMAISTPQPGSAIEIANTLTLAETDDAFIETSRLFADRLTAAQTRRDLPGGVLVVFSGMAGAPHSKIVGIIKAEQHASFRRTPALGVQFLKDLFLGPQTKLYKSGIFAHEDAGTGTPQALPNGWRAFVHDSQMSPSKRDGAQYFFDTFLGCEIPVNSAQLTKSFYDNTKAFINQTDLPPEKKIDLHTGLYTYLKVDQTPTVQVAAFSNQYLQPELRDTYSHFMTHHSFPDGAVSKDISEIQSYLKRRKVTFSRNIQLTAPPDAFDDLVTVKTIEGESVTGAPSPKWTEIIVRDSIRDQE